MFIVTNRGKVVLSDCMSDDFFNQRFCSGAFSRGQIRVGVKKRLKSRWVRSEEHTSELQSLMRISYAVFCLKKKTTNTLTLATKTNTSYHLNKIRKSTIPNQPTHT